MAPKQRQKIEIEKTHRDPLLSFNQAVTVDCSDFLGTALISNYSYLSATIGLTRMARRAGKYAARTPTANNAPTTHAIVIGSFGETPYNVWPIKRVAAKAHGSPMPTPALISTHVSRSTILRTPNRSAPKVIRIPISRVRCVTAYAIRPYTPTAASKSANAPKNAESMAVTCSCKMERSMFCLTV